MQPCRRKFFNSDSLIYSGAESYRGAIIGAFKQTGRLLRSLYNGLTSSAIWSIYNASEA